MKSTMKYSFFLLFILLISGNSCKKKDLTFTFEGKIKSLASGENLGQVQLKAYTYGLTDNKKTLKGEALTDAGGNYTLSINRERYEKVVLEISKHNYFTTSKTFPFDDLSTEDINAFNTSISPKSWTRFVIKNIISPSPSDQLKIQKVAGKTDCENCCPNTTKVYNGILDTVIICPNDGGTNLEFYYWVNNDMPTNGINTVFNTPFDTVDYDITY